MRATTFPDVLAELVRRDAARPLVTFYDDATGERVELSVATYANWVAKTAGLAQDELDLTRGDVVLLDLPAHWLGAVWLGAAWSLGLAVTTDPARRDEAAAVVCGPQGVQRYGEAAAAAHGGTVVALSLRPLGGRFVDPLPDGVVDYGAVVLAQPDAFTAYDPPAATDVAWTGHEGPTTQEALLSEAAADETVERGGRLLTDANPCTPEGRGSLLGPLLRGAGVVWVANPDPARWDERAAQERVTAQLRVTRS